MPLNKETKPMDINGYISLLINTLDTIVCGGDK